ncbi:hypothetical protein RI129_002088 [Pyrocoelia pectoralis]|uniref:Uncharacterized protein n=1 Tax=Pyrocoelia pectoralis TaxID=417401 RepID=A0AAN7ZSM5_9COLE
MECSEGFARCGADCKVNFGSIQKRVDVDSSDSNLSDVDIFFGNSGNRHKVKLYTNIDIKRKTSRVEKAEEIKEFVGKTTTAQVAKFARQPAERDQDYSANKPGPSPSRHIKYQQLNLCRKMSESGNVSDTSSRNFNADEYANPRHDSKFVNTKRCVKHFNADIANAYPSHIPEKCFRNCPCLKNQKRSNNETRYIKFDPNMAEGQRHVKQKDECKCVCKYQSQPQPLPYKGTKKGKIYPESRILEEHCDDENVQTCKKQHCNCKDVQPPPRDLQYQDVDDQGSCCSDYSGHTEFPELVYQHTEEFLDLVNELGDTLSLRNKNRVETTIREFEYLSRQNKNLEKPIFDEETEDDCQRRAVLRETCCCDCPRRKPPKNHKVCFTKYDTEEKDVIRVTTQYAPFTECSKHCKMPKSAPCYQRTYNSRWARDYRTGKWYRMCENDGEVEEYFDDCPKSPHDLSQPPTPPPFPSSPHVPHCRRTNVRRSSKYGEEKYRRSSPTCKCCTKIRDTW